MKPEDLKSPFSWQNRFITIHDRVWYLPEHYKQHDAFTFPGWLHPTTFTEKRPIKVEYCSGNGAWIAAKALQDPHSNWVAIEKQFTRARKIWAKVKNLKLDNLLVVCGEGFKVTNWYFQNQSISDVFINFPDPWPKRRHAKHRIMQPAFIKEMERILQAGGKLTFVTDDHDYSALTIELLFKYPGFESCFSTPYVTDLEEYGTSYFEDFWRNKGKEIRYHQFRKKTGLIGDK
jgi:tRNA (guanine-N7-)-methyltransferase